MCKFKGGLVVACRILVSAQVLLVLGLRLRVWGLSLTIEYLMFPD